MPGIVLGTIGYMAPEQVRGLAADHRADIFAFGTVLYEMLSGVRAFRGDTTIDTMTAILKEDPPDLPVTERHIPPALARIVDRCLEKAPAARFQSAGDLAFALEGLSSQSTETHAASLDIPKKKRLVHAAAAVVVGVGLVGAFALGLYVRREVSLHETRLQAVNPPGTTAPVQLAISPDGRSLAVVTNTEGIRRVWITRLDSEVPAPLEGTDGATNPCWSPDSRSIAFFAGGKLKRVDVQGGAAQVLADTTIDVGCAWNGNGDIVFTAANTAPLYRVAAGGGRAVEATQVSPPQTGHRWPEFLPDGRRFLFFANGSPDVRGVYVGSLDSREARRILEADTKAVFAPPDFLLFGRGETLFAQRVDLTTLAPAGEAFVIAQRVAQNPAGVSGSVAASASQAGPIAYRPAVVMRHEVVWLDRGGREIAHVGEFDTTDSPTGYTRLSPDRRTVAFSRTANGNHDLWMMELARGVLRRFTSDPAADQSAVWSPDGGRLAFISYRRGRYDLYIKPFAGQGTEQLLLETTENKNIDDWSPDGRFILYPSQNPKTARDIWALPLESDRKPFLVVQTPTEDGRARFSPDGNWIVYQSSETGRSEIYLQPFPGPGSPVQISTSGGADAQWRDDGREIFFISRDDRLMAVPISLRIAPSLVEPGTPRALFPMRRTTQFSVSADGNRILVNAPVDDELAAPVTVILNWAARQNGEK